MSDTSLFVLPVFILVFMTFTVLCLMAFSRKQSVQKGEIHPNYFKVYQLREGTVLNEKMVQISRHYNNLLEQPILYYFLILLTLQLKQVSGLMILLSWLYVLARIIHSIIHLGNNHVVKRLISFTVASVILLSMWINLAINALF